MNVVYREQSWQFDKPVKVTTLLRRIDVLPESVLVVRNGQLVAEDQTLEPDDEVKIVDVISGG